MTGLSTGAVTGVVDRLERAGYVTQARDPQDRRQVSVGPDLERFDRDTQRNAPTRPPATLEFLREYPAGAAARDPAIRCRPRRCLRAGLAGRAEGAASASKGAGGRDRRGAGSSRPAVPGHVAG